MIYLPSGSISGPSRYIHTFDRVLAECTSVLYARTYVDCGMRDKLRKSVISTAMARQWYGEYDKKSTGLFWRKANLF